MSTFRFILLRQIQLSKEVNESSHYYLPEMYNLPKKIKKKKNLQFILTISATNTLFSLFNRRSNTIWI